MSRRTLYVSGFSSTTRAKDLAAEFERYGRLVRCDIPAPKNPASRVYAFVEFEDDRDAAEAKDRLQDHPIDKEHSLEMQWAKQPPSSIWRFDGPPAKAAANGASTAGGSGYHGGRPRSRSPPRRPPSYDDRNGGPRAERGYDDRPRGYADDRRGPSGHDSRGGGYEPRGSRGGYSSESRGAGGHADSRGAGAYSEPRGYPPPRSAGYDDRGAPPPPRGGYDDRGRGYRDVDQRPTYSSRDDYDRR